MACISTKTSSHRHVAFQIDSWRLNARSWTTRGQNLTECHAHSPSCFSCLSNRTHLSMCIHSALIKQSIPLTADDYRARWTQQIYTADFWGRTRHKTFAFLRRRPNGEMKAALCRWGTQKWMNIHVETTVTQTSGEMPCAISPSKKQLVGWCWGRRLCFRYQADRVTALHCQRETVDGVTRGKTLMLLIFQHQMPFLWTPFLLIKGFILDDSPILQYKCP